jgi:hypothetical protein
MSTSSTASPGRLRELGVIHADRISASTTNEQLVAIFDRHPKLPALPF